MYFCEGEDAGYEMLMRGVPGFDRCGGCIRGGMCRFCMKKRRCRRGLACCMAVRQ